MSAKMVYKSLLIKKLLMLCHCFLAYVNITLTHLFDIYIFHTVEVDNALSCIVGNIYFSSSSLVLIAFAGKE